MVRTGARGTAKMLFGKRIVTFSIIAIIATIAFSNFFLPSRTTSAASCGLFSCNPFDVSNDNGNTTSPTVATSGSFVYVTWDESLNSVWIRINSNYGNPNNWENSTELSTTTGGVGEVVMSVNESYVYVAWSQVISSTDQIMFVSSNNYGQTFSSPMDVPQVLGHGNDPTITPVLASWGSTVYLAWDVDSGSNDGSWVTASSNAGSTWSHAYQASDSQHEPQLAATSNYGYFVGDGSAYAYTNDTGATWNDARSGATGFGDAGSEPWIAASGPNVYLTSEMKGSNGAGVIKVWYSSDSGQNFNETVVSGSIVNDWQPQISAEGNDVFLAFRTLGDQNITPPETISAYIVASYDSGADWTAPQMLSQGGHLTGWPLDVSVQGQNVYTMFGSMTTSTGQAMDAYASYSSNFGASFSTTDISNNNVGVAAPPTDIESASIASFANGTIAGAVWQQSTSPYNLNSTSKYSGAGTWQIYFNGPFDNPVTSTSSSSSSTSSLSTSVSTIVSSSSSVRSVSTSVTTLATSTAAKTTQKSMSSSTDIQITFPVPSPTVSSSDNTSPKKIGFSESLAIVSGVLVIILVGTAAAVRSRKNR